MVYREDLVLGYGGFEFELDDVDDWHFRVRGGRERGGFGCCEMGGEGCVMNPNVRNWSNGYKGPVLMNVIIEGLCVKMNEMLKNENRLIKPRGLSQDTCRNDTLDGKYGLGRIHVVASG